MAKLTDFRVALDPKVHLGLEVLAAQKHVSMKDLASAIIWQGIGPIVRTFAEQSGVRGEDLLEVQVSQGAMEVTPKVHDVILPKVQSDISSSVQMDSTPKAQMDEGCGTSTAADLMAVDRPAPKSEPRSVANRPRKLQLRISKNPAVQAQIKDLWEGTELTREQISIKVGYPRATVQKWINTCMDKGTLQPRA